MVRRTPALLALASLPLAWAVSCASESPSEAPKPAPTPSASSGPSLAFDEPAPLMMQPGATATLRVQRTPAAAAQVRFALLDDHGDAALDEGEASADAQGVATARLRAPRRAAAFRVRASLAEGGASAERAVVVSGEGTGSLSLRALYTGKRPTGAWHGSVALGGGGCGAAPADGPLGVEGALPLDLRGVPAGSPLRVVLRSGKLVVGCAELPPLSIDEHRPVEVVVKNTLAVLGPLALRLTMQIEPEPGAWGKAIDQWSGRFQSAYLGGQLDDPSGARALLDTMMVSAPLEARAALLLARKQMDWDTSLGQLFGQQGGPAQALSWLAEAGDRLRTAPGVLRGVLRPSKAAVSFEPEAVLALGPDDALTSKPITWKVDVDDTLQASGEVSYWPTRLLGKVASAVAAEGSPAGTSATDRLIQATGCETVAKTLGGVPALCGPSCLSTLCIQSLEAMWARAVGADEAAGAVSTCSFVASGAVSLDADAVVTGFTGSWVGALHDTQAASAPVPLSGEASAAPSP